MVAPKGWSLSFHFKDWQTVTAVSERIGESVKRDFPGNGCFIVLQPPGFRLNIGTTEEIPAGLLDHIRQICREEGGEEIDLTAEAMEEPSSSS